MYSQLPESGTSSRLSAYVNSSVRKPCNNLPETKTWENPNVVECKSNDEGDDDCPAVYFEDPFNDEIRDEFPDDVEVDVDERVESVENESSAFLLQQAFSSSVVLDNVFVSVSSQEDIPRAESHNDERKVTTFSPVKSVEQTERSDLGSWERVVKLFRCAADGSFEVEEEFEGSLDKDTTVDHYKEDNDIQASKISHIRTYSIADDITEESKDRQLDVDGTSRHDRSSHESISSALSNRSRRGQRSFKTKNPSSEQEVDIIIEIAASQPERTKESSEGESKCTVSADHLSHQHYLDYSKKIEVREEDATDVVPHDAVNCAFNSTNMITSIGRAPSIALRDQQTMFPDNLPPMARLRYFSHIGGKYGLLVTEERCYV
jgi:hypothetical protein